MDDKPDDDLLSKDLTGRIGRNCDTDNELMKSAEGLPVKKVIAELNKNLDKIEKVYDNLLRKNGPFLTTVKYTFESLFEEPVPKQKSNETESQFEDRLRCLITVEHIMAVRKMCLEIKKIDTYLANIVMLIDQIHALSQSLELDFGIASLRNNLLEIVTKNISLLDTMYLGRVNIISKTHKRNQIPRIEELKKLYVKSVIYLSNFYSEDVLIREIRLAKSDLIPIRHKFKLSLESMFSNELGTLSMIQ